MINTINKRLFQNSNNIKLNIKNFSLIFKINKLKKNLD